MPEISTSPKAETRRGLQPEPVTPSEDRELRKPSREITLPGGMRAKVAPGVTLRRLENGDVEAAAGEAKAVFREIGGAARMVLRNEKGNMTSYKLLDDSDSLQIRAERGRLNIDLLNKPVNDTVRATPITVSPSGHHIGQPRDIQLKRDSLTDFSADNVTRVFNKGVDLARKYAESQGFELRCRPTGMLARSLKQDVRAIELQTVEIRRPGGKWSVIGTILPEKHHLQTLHSPQEIYGKMKKMIDADALGARRP